MRAGHGDGVTYVLTKQDEFAAIDLDHCRDAVTGSVECWAQLMLEQALHSYAEITPSGERFADLGYRCREFVAP